MFRIRIGRRDHFITIIPTHHFRINIEVLDVLIHGKILPFHAGIPNRMIIAQYVAVVV